MNCKLFVYNERNKINRGTKRIKLLDYTVAVRSKSLDRLSIYTNILYILYINVIKMYTYFQFIDILYCFYLNYKYIICITHFKQDNYS